MRRVSLTLAALALMLLPAGLASTVPCEAQLARQVVAAVQGQTPQVKMPQPVAPDIRFPVFPTPAPQPSSITKLSADQLYVIDADVSFMLLASPSGLVSIDRQAGPVMIWGRFVDGTGKNEKRTYKGKLVVVVAADGVGKVELLIIAAGVTSESDVIRRTLDVDNGGPIPPDPKPIPPDPKPIPEPTDPLWPSLKVAFSVEADKVKAGQLASIYRTSPSTLLAAKTQGQLIDVMHRAAEALLPGALPKTRRVLADELNAKVPATVAGPLTDTLRAQYTVQFSRFAALLEVLAK